jgi:phosphoserine phosphatase RsbU/P
MARSPASLTRQAVTKRPAVTVPIQHIPSSGDVAPWVEGCVYSWRMSVLRLLPLVFAAIVSLWLVSRKIQGSESRAYWRTVPLLRLKYLIAAQCFTGASLVFFIDMLRGGTAPRGEVVLLAVIAAPVFAALFLLRTRGTRQVALGVTAIVMALFVVVSRLDISRFGSGPVSTSGMAFDGIVMFVMMGIGVQTYRTHISTEGARQLRAEAELALAHRLQRVLVPPVVFHNSKIEIYGRSIPSEQVGGDLVDAVASDAGVLAYLLDVSGHGIPAGALMGAIKSAMRCSASLALGDALGAVNRVLPAVKEPAMYATLAAVRFGAADREVEYTLAGHLPILHYRAATRTIDLLTLQQFPLGFFEDSQYETRRVGCAPGDVFAIFSDGIAETANATDDPFGVDRIAAQLEAVPSRPLEEIAETVLAAAEAYGTSHDDRSILVIRVL